MIIDALITLASTLFNAFLSSRPSWAFSIGTSAGQEIVWLYGMDNIIPVSETCQCALVSITLFFAMSTTKAGVKMIDWITNIIP